MPYFNSNGHRFFYRERGNGEPLFILPGNTASSASHEDDISYFTDRYHVVSLDFLGTGRSDRQPVWPQDWWECGARDAIALLDHLQYENCRVLGTSGGAIVALLMAILYPGRVKQVIADSVVEFLPAPSLSEEVKQRAAAPPELSDFWRAAHGDDWRQVVAADSELLLRIEQVGGSCFQGRLTQIGCPVLLSASKEDEFLPDVEKQIPAMARQIKDCRILLNEHGGHPLIWSEPAIFRQAADDFLKHQDGG